MNGLILPFEVAWLIPAFPLAAALVITLFGARLREGGGWLAVLAGALSAGLALPIGWQALRVEEDFRAGFTWFAVGDYQLNFGIYIDKLTALMIMVVSFVSFLILVYSIAYMGGEGRRKRRYYAEMTLFIGSMLGLVLADNYLEVYVFWELVGLCSYLLIGFWYERPSASAAAIKAFLVTRVGDLLFLFGLILLVFHFKTLDFEALFAMSVPPDQLWVIGLAGLFIFGGAVGKSAQFPLHIWLPDAMEGPTTVSALIHAAAMVKAGVYLVARTMPLLVQVPTNLLIIALIGGFTALLAATLATMKVDIKRVLAYSTISQLGYMFLGLGVGGLAYAASHEATGYTAGLFHLMNHAFFKALLFLCAGSVMHALNDNTNLREMGALWPKLKITGTAMLIGALANAGIPPTSGFWSKDEILASAMAAAGANPLVIVAWVFGFVTVFLTAFYLFRMWFLAFAGRSRWEPDVHPHESPPLMTVPLVILAIFAFGSGFSVFGGFSQYIAYGEPHAFIPREYLVETFSNPWTLVSILLALSGIGLAYLLYHRGLDLARYRTALTAGVYRVLDRNYYLDDLANAIAGKVTVGLATVIDVFDRLAVDGAINGIGSGSTQLGERLRRTVTGYVGDYAGWVLAGIVVLLVAFIWR